MQVAFSSYLRLGNLSFLPRCRFDSAGLEAVIKELVKLKLDNEDELLFQEDPACKV
jgi:hypothetical protein